MEQNSLTNSAGCSIMLDFMAISYNLKLTGWLLILNGHKPHFYEPR